MAGRTGKPVTRRPAFWDAIALVPLCVRQSMTLQAIALYLETLLTPTATATISCEICLRQTDGESIPIALNAPEQ